MFYRELNEWKLLFEVFIAKKEENTERISTSYKNSEIQYIMIVLESLFIRLLLLFYIRTLESNIIFKFEIKVLSMKDVYLKYGICSSCEGSFFLFQLYTTLSLQLEGICPIFNSFCLWPRIVEGEKGTIASGKPFLQNITSPRPVSPSFTTIQIWFLLTLG